MWRTFRKAWPLIALGAIINIATTAFLVIRPLPLPSWLPGEPVTRAGGAMDTPVALPDLRHPFAVTSSDGKITVTWTASGAPRFYRAVAVAETGNPEELPCHMTIAPSEGSARCAVTGVRNGVPYLVSIFPMGDDSTPLRTFRTVPQPAVLTSADVVAWFDASDYAAIEPNPGEPTAIGSRVVALQDKSSHQYDVQQYESKRQPTIGQMRGLPALDLDGGDVLTMDNRGFPAADSPSTVMVVAAQDDPNTELTCFHNLLSWGSDAFGRARIIHKGCGTGLAFVETFGTWIEQQPTLPWPVGQPAVLSAVFAAEGTTTRIDGARSYSWTATPQVPMDTTTDGVVSIGGAVWDALSGWQGRIGEIIVFDRVLSEAELEAVEGYLGAKWQVTLEPTE